MEPVIKQNVTAQIRLLSARSLDSTDKCGPVVRNDNLGVTNNRLAIVTAGAETGRNSEDLGGDLASVPSVAREQSGPRSDLAPCGKE